MSGVQLKTIADYQAAIKQLDRNKPADRAKIAEYNQKIGELLQGQGKVETTRGDLNIYEGNNFKFNANIADADKIAQLNEFNKNAMVNGKKQGSKAAHQNIKDKFGADFDEAAYKAKKEELKTAEKQLKELEKESKKVKFDKNNPAAFNEAKKEIEAKVAEQRKVVGNLQAEMNDLEVGKTGASKKFAKKYEKAARKNVEQYEKTQDVVETFLDKTEAKAWEKEHPGQKAAVVNENDLRALTTLYFKGTDEIKKADADLEVAKQSGDETAIKEAEENARQIHDKYDDYAGIFEKDDKGEPQFNRINTKKVQNILVDKSGGDQNFNLDEVKVMSDDLGMKKGQIKHLAKEFGFGTENVTGQKLKAAGIAAASALAGEALGGLFNSKKAISEQKAHAEAQGESKILETLDVDPMSGNAYYHLLEASGGKAVADAVAKAVAKYVPGAGLLAGPALAGLSAFFLTNGTTEDVFGGANVDKVLDNIQVAEKNAQPVLKQIKDMNITGDPKRDKAIKAAVLKTAMGEDTKAMNLRELQSALADLEKTKDIIGKLPVPEPPKPPVEPTVTERTVWDTDGLGFRDSKGNLVSVNGHEAQGATGHARDHEKLKNRGASLEKNDVNAKAQFVIADEKGETKVTADIKEDGTFDHEAPAIVELSDNTNGKVNTYTYVKITDDDITNGSIKVNGKVIKLTGLEGRKGPFYINTAATDDKGNLKSKSVEIFQLELQKETEVVEEKDEQGNITKTTIVRPKYHFEQYKGMNGSNETSMQWNNRARRK